MKNTFKMSMVTLAVLASTSVYAERTQPNLLINKDSIGNQLSVEGVRSFTIGNDINQNSKGAGPDQNARSNNVNSNQRSQGPNTATGTTNNAGGTTNAGGGNQNIGGSVPMDKNGLANFVGGNIGNIGNASNMLSCFQPPCVTMAGPQTSSGPDWLDIAKVVLPIIGAVAQDQDVASSAAALGSGIAIHQQMRTNPDGTTDWSSAIWNQDGTINARSTANLANIAVQVGAATNENNEDLRRAAQAGTIITGAWNIHASTLPQQQQQQQQQQQRVVQVGVNSDGSPRFAVVAQPAQQQQVIQVGVNQDGTPHMAQVVGVNQDGSLQVASMPQQQQPQPQPQPRQQQSASTAPAQPSGAWQAAATMLPLIGTAVGGETGQWLNMAGSGAALYNNGITNAQGQVTGTAIVNMANIAVQGSALTGSESAARAAQWTGAGAAIFNASNAVNNHQVTQPNNTANSPHVDQTLKMAEANLANSNYREAIAQSRAALSLAPGNQSAQNMLSRSLAAETRALANIEVFHGVPATQPNNTANSPHVEQMFGMANTALENGNYNAAVAHARSILSVDPNNKRAQLLLDSTRARQLEHTRRYTTITHETDATQPNNTANSQPVEQMFRMANTALDARQYDTVVAHARSILSLDPNNQRAQLLLDSTLARQLEYTRRNLIIHEPATPPAARTTAPATQPAARTTAPATPPAARTTAPATQPPATPPAANAFPAGGNQPPPTNRIAPAGGFTPEQSWRLIQG